MNNRIAFILLAMGVASLSGCASMSSDECIASDWSAIGYEDGSRGYTTGSFAKHRKACAKHGITANFAAYQNGRDQGLLEYCQPGRGFNVGANGGSYNGVCSVNLEADFLDAYNAGHHLYALRSSVNQANNSIHAKEHRLDKIEDRTIEIGIALIADDTTRDDRIYLLAEMKNLAEETGELEAEIRELYDIRARSQAELENYQHVVADMGY